MSKSKLLLIFLGVLVFFAFLAALTLNYETNDDPFMLLINSGALTGGPSAHVVFSNIIIGFVLKFFYEVCGAVSWYTWYLVSVHLISMIVILTAYSYKQKRTLPEFFMFIIVYLLGYQSLWLVNLQFTSTALICGFASLVFLQSQYDFKYKIWGSGILFVLAFLIRKESFVPIMLFGVLITAFNFLQKKPVRNYIVFLALMLPAYAGLQCLNNNNDAYVKSNYYAYQKAAEILTNNPVEVTDEQLKIHGLTRNDMNLYNAWFWVDRKLFDDQKMKALSQSGHVARTGKDLLAKCLEYISDERFAILMFLVSFLYVPVILDKKIKTFLVLNALLVFVLVLYLLMTARLPKRVSTPIWCYLVMLNCACLSAEIVRRRWRYGILGLLVVLSGYKFWCVCKLSALNKKHESLYVSAIKQVNDHPDQLFITMGKSFPIENLHVFDRSDNLIRNHNLIFTGWLINTPTYSELLKVNKISSIPEGLLYNKQARLIVLNQNFIKTLEQYYAEHYNTRVRFVRDETNQGVLQVYRASLQ
jgi:membrane-associated HD superfamily phosphohydrolase